MLIDNYNRNLIPNYENYQSQYTCAWFDTVWNLILGFYICPDQYRVWRLKSKASDINWETTWYQTSAIYQLHNPETRNPTLHAQSWLIINVWTQSDPHVLPLRSMIVQLFQLKKDTCVSLVWYPHRFITVSGLPPQKRFSESRSYMS